MIALPISWNFLFPHKFMLYTKSTNAFTILHIFSHLGVLPNANFVKVKWFSISGARFRKIALEVFKMWMKMLYCFLKECWLLFSEQQKIQKNAQHRHQGKFSLYHWKSSLCYPNYTHQKPERNTEKFIYVHSIFWVLKLNHLKNSFELGFSELKVALSVLFSVLLCTWKSTKRSSIMFSVILHASGEYLQGN